MRKFIRIAAATAIAAVAVAVPTSAASAHTSASGSEVPCEEWYIDADHDSLWNNCDAQGRRQQIEVTDTQGGVSPLCMKPGVNVLAYGEVGTGYIRAVHWKGKYCG